MAVGIIVALVLVVVAMLNRRKNPFFPEPHRVPRPHVRSRLRWHHRPRLTPVGVAYHEALHAHGRH